MKMIEMTNLTAQYEQIKNEIDKAVLDVIQSGQYINGKPVEEFSANLAAYTGAKHVIPCASGTDALLISLMALDLQPGDEVIIPNFTFIAAAEVIALLKLTPVLIDVDPKTFNMDVNKISGALSVKTKAIIPVHLFGQCCDMTHILKIARESGLHVIEDNAQSIGAVYTFPNGKKQQAGTMGDIGTFSFFPSKNLGCYGDGGAIATNDEKLAKKMEMITVHGRTEKYIHQIIGCNSRLDNLQAAVLNVKLTYLDAYTKARINAAQIYDEGLKHFGDLLEIPFCIPESSHVYNQYTLKIKGKKRDNLKEYLAEKEIPTTIYYPCPVHKQQAFRGIIKVGSNLGESENLCQSVLSIPMHTELQREQINYITEQIGNYG
jgi:dTDP-4-amino-4,6-dideoxygalactose transaminase